MAVDYLGLNVKKPIMNPPPKSRRNNVRPDGSKKHKKCCEMTRPSPPAAADNPAITPTITPTFQQAVALHRAGQLVPARDIYRAIVQNDPHHANALHMLGVIAAQTQDYAQAIALISQAISVSATGNVAMYNNLANALGEHGDFDAAIVQYQQALALQPDYAEARNNLGVVFNNLGRFDEAIDCYQQALASAPDYAQAYFNIGVVYQEQEQYALAMRHYERAIALKPDYVQAHCNAGIVHKEQGDTEAAIASYQRTLALDPNYITALGGLFYIQQARCEWAGYAATAAKLSHAIAHGARSRPFAFLSVSPSAAAQQRCAQTVIAEKHRPQQPLWTGERYPHTKIRVAYISADFRQHPVSFLTVGLFEQHDRRHFEIIALSLRPAENNDVGRRVRLAFDSFIDVSAKTDVEIAALIRHLEIDIAVDLMGFTKHSRVSIFAHRPAPVHINYLGYPATMGAAYMDYIIADPHLVPPEQRAYYTEKVVYLPDCFQANDAKRAIAATRPTRLELGLPATGLVFCCFNNSYKINPAFFEVWMRLLGQVENSVLWLVADETHVQHNLRQEAARHGINPQRLVFAARINYADHLARFAHADLFLDTLPFNAGTTASDALWAGVPVLTCVGEALAARMAGSLLHAMGLPELITDNLADYGALALKLAATPTLLAALREKLAENRNTYPLFDTARFTRHLETAYTTMWERTQRGEPPESFAVPN
jgi:predicted O-linked N-acetylglucosamine transferase (SPINDLY family)